MVYCKRKLNGAVSGSHKMIVTRNMKNFNQEAFVADAACICWETVVNNFSDTNDMIREWLSLFSAIVEKHAPVREMRVSDRNSSWIMSELKSLMISRDRLKKAVVKYKSPTMMCSYKAIRNRVNCLYIKLQKQYFAYKIIKVV